MYISRIKRYSFPKINLFHYVAVDKCIHFRRTPDEYIAFFIVKGDMYLREETTYHHLTEGDWILLKPGEEHEGYKISEHCTYFYIHFDLESLTREEIDEQTLHGILNRNKIDALQGRELTSDILLPEKYHSASHMAYETILQLLNRGDRYYNSYKEYSDLQAACLLLDLFIHLSHLFSSQMLTERDKSIKRSTFVVYDLLREINYNYMKKFTSERIEDQFSCNFDYINRIFKKETGQTIFSYLTDVRISQAKTLLATGNLPITSVAQRVGYEDIYYFSNVFKKNTGLSPTQYRKMILQN